MANYFIKGKVVGRRDEEWNNFHDVFQGVDNGKAAFETYVAAIRTKRDRVPQEIEIYTFNKV